MLITHPLVSALAFIAVFASNAVALTNSSTETLGSAGNSTAMAKLSTQKPGNASIQSNPDPSDPPDFNHNFKLVFDGGSCSSYQRAVIQATMKNIAGLADRGRLWGNDDFHDWQDEVDYWFGQDSSRNYKWIQNNFLRLGMAAKQGKSAWINTWVYAYCNSGPSSLPQLKCTDQYNVFNNINDIGYFQYWDTSYWNFCPGFFDRDDFATKVRSTLDDPDKSIHFMENYFDTREQWLIFGFMSIRSIGIEKMINWYINLQAPAITRNVALNDGLDLTLRNYMSYYYTALSITIPESFSWGARPVVSSFFSVAWSDDSDMNNSNGTVLPFVDGSVPPAQAQATTDETFTETATAPSSVSTVAFATSGDIAFPTLTDTAHTSTENCFTFLPSILVQGSQSEVCDCGTTTAPLTALGSSTGCALSNSIFAINSFPIETGLVTPSASTAPVSTTPQPAPTRALEIMFKAGTVNGIPLDAWSVYSHSIGQATKINACNGGFWYRNAGPTVSFPTSLGPFTGKTYTGCQYHGPATAPGSVSCPSMSTWSDCSKAPVSTQVCYNGNGYDEYYAQVECEF